jgi:hypothetical protein
MPVYQDTSSAEYVTHITSSDHPWRRSVYDLQHLATLSMFKYERFY